MATSGGVKANKTVYLTPGLFRKLDTIARTEVGSIVGVYRSDPAKPIGYVDAMAASVYNCPRHEVERLGGRYSVTNDVTHVKADMSVIHVANFIELSRFLGNGYTFDWNGIPTSKIYEFLLWHEIAHIIHGDVSFIFEFQVKGLYGYPAQMQSFVKMRRGQELRADRWAWSKLFQTTAMPKERLNGAEADDLLSFLDECELNFREHPVKIPPPISTKPNEYIYWRHEKEGIPWAGPGKRIAARA